MIASSYLAIVAGEQRLADTILRQLGKNVSQSAFTCTYGAVRKHLAPDADGLLLLVYERPEDTRLVAGLVQEVRLLKGPPVVLVDASGRPGGSPRSVQGQTPDTSLSPPPALAALAPHVLRQLRWPEEVGALESLVAKRLGRVRKLPVGGEESLEELIARRLLSQTPSLLSLVQHLALAAAHDVTVLLTGETGTGKTFLARLIHDCSPRKDHRFLVVPCGALAVNLVESELFGHTKGAFTGADFSKEGKFSAVGAGTLLLEEIDTLGLEQQAALLRVIETSEYEPVGSNETRLCTARIIVASNWDLDEAVARGKFRRDLYYRLDVMSFHLPPLRERVQDIDPLVRTMAARFNEKFHKGLFDISPAALAALKSFSWPGNIRQLENVVQQAVLVCNGPRLLPEHLPEPLQFHAALVPENGFGAADSLHHNRELLERTSIHRALVNSGYSRARAATALGVSRVTLYKKMKKYGLMEVPLQTCPPLSNRA
jgi:DNA-binding NtrC family response regulator